MEELIKFYLLEQPRSVSDMIRELTEKELSSAASVRRKQIPKIAGNWFKKDSGYLWRLREQGVIRDVGRQYALDKSWLIDELMQRLSLYDRFPGHAEQGDRATVEAAYADFMPEYTLGEFKQALREEVFSGRVMKEVFAFEVWRDALTVPEPDGRRITSYRPVVDFWSIVHLCFISSILKSRRTHLTDRMEDRNRYFTWKNRRTRLGETQDVLVRKMMHACFPWADRDVDGAYTDERVERIASAIGSTGTVLPEQTFELLGNMYLLYFDDGPGLFQQRREADSDVHLFCNLLERGVLIAGRDLEQDPTTGDYIVPLADMHSYLEDLAVLCAPSGVLRE